MKFCYETGLLIHCFFNVFHSYSEDDVEEGGIKIINFFMKIAIF
jgi:hypothetical protein